MEYSDDQLNELAGLYSQAFQRFNDLQIRLLRLGDRLNNDRAKEFLNHGVCRRLATIFHCIERIFETLPPEGDQPISYREKKDVDAFLQSALINFQGLVDNCAWVLVHERGLAEEIRRGRHGVGLFQEETLEHVGEQLRGLVESARVQRWNNEYLKNYRDALAHQIPPYVPPAILNAEDMERYKELEQQIQKSLEAEDIDRANELHDEMSQLGVSAKVFAHSFRENNGPILLHNQLLTDALLLCELLDSLIEELSQD